MGWIGRGGEAWRSVELQKEADPTCTKTETRSNWSNHTMEHVRSTRSRTRRRIA